MIGTAPRKGKHLTVREQETKLSSTPHPSYLHKTTFQEDGGSQSSVLV
jgi:hypothetical protein